ncbi:MAG: hypothetical protein AAF993_01580 [Pseudomonadota bacterium]
MTFFGLSAGLSFVCAQASLADQVVYLSHNQYGEPEFSDVAHPEAQRIELPTTQSLPSAADNQGIQTAQAASQVELMLQVADDLAAARRARDAERDQRRKEREAQRQAALQAQARASDVRERSGYYYPLGFPHRTFPHKTKRPHNRNDDNYGHGYRHDGTVASPRAGRDRPAPREPLRVRFR